MNKRLKVAAAACLVAGTFVAGNVRAQGIPLVLITHDLGQARRLADEIIFLHKGRICERTPAKDFFNAPKSPEAAAYLKGEIVF